jgi:hypothetical protein
VNPPSSSSAKLSKLSGENEVVFSITRLCLSIGNAREVGKGSVVRIEKRGPRLMVATNPDGFYPKFCKRPGTNPDKIEESFFETARLSRRKSFSKIYHNGRCVMTCHGLACGNPSVKRSTCRAL